MKIIQITDNHLFANDSSEMYGIKTNINFKKVIGKIKAEELNHTDYIFLTGDISQDETLESYQVIADQLSKLNIPIYWIPGNHDDIEKCITVFSQTENFHYEHFLSVKDWYFIFLNTHLDKENTGYLSDTELARLKQELSVSRDKKHVIVMHHHPAPTNTPLIDKYILKNREEFWQLIKDFQVELIICGHVHGDYRYQCNQVTIESAPATSVQWQKGTTELELDKAIGYKIYYFHQDTYDSEAKYVS